MVFGLLGKGEDAIETKERKSLLENNTGPSARDTAVKTTAHKNDHRSKPTSYCLDVGSEPPKELQVIRTKPLPLSWMKVAAGMGCANCSQASEEETLEEVAQMSHELESLLINTRSTNVSPMVVAPLATAVSAGLVASLHPIHDLLTEYTAACRLYGADRPHSAVLTTIRFSLPCLRVGTRDFNDVDMLAICEVLLRHTNGALSHLERLDFSLGLSQPRRSRSGGIGSHGALALAKVLQVSRKIKHVALTGHLIGPYGASAIFIAASKNPVLHTLVMRRCRIGERAALVFKEMAALSPSCGLRHLDVSANIIGYFGTSALEESLQKRSRCTNLPEIVMDLDGNLVFQEIMNGVTHALGVLLSLIGAALLSNRTKGMSARYVICCNIYSVSLFVLYMSSTLYHSFFTLRKTKWIFEVIDKCAIYILIAGCYTSYLQFLAHDRLYFSVGLVSYVWVCCFLGIAVQLVSKNPKFRRFFSLALYLSMGWSACLYLNPLSKHMPLPGFRLVFAGGIAYTGGVPFFVRNRNVDHAIWHLFVLAGSIFHWICLYFYVCPLYYTVVMGSQDESLETTGLSTDVGEL